RAAACAAQRADAVVQSQPLRSWRQLRWREGSQGWLVGQFVAVRCWRGLPDGGRVVGWLVGGQTLGGPRPRKDYRSNFGPQTPLDQLGEYGPRGPGVEPAHEEAKGLLGWDQYQGRLWQGFHRHAVTVMLAYSFLVWQEWGQRQRARRRGRRRRPFSPSPGPQAAAAAAGPSTPRRLATAGSRPRTG